MQQVILTNLVQLVVFAFGAIAMTDLVVGSISNYRKQVKQETPQEVSVPSEIEEVPTFDIVLEILENQIVQPVTTLGDEQKEVEEVVLVPNPTGDEQKELPTLQPVPNPYPDSGITIGVDEVSVMNESPDYDTVKKQIDSLQLDNVRNIAKALDIPRKINSTKKRKEILQKEIKQKIDNPETLRVVTAALIGIVF